MYKVEIQLLYTVNKCILDESKKKKLKQVIHLGLG